MSGMEQTDRHHRSVLPYVLMLAFAAMPPLALELIGVFGDHSVPKGQCEGLGWGCVLSPADVAKFLLLIVLPVMILWAAGAMVALTLLRRRARYRARPAIVQGLLPVVPALVLALLFVFI
jgi:hypothetical protein